MASISGRVTDVTGAVLRGAQVLAARPTRTSDHDHDRRRWALPFSLSARGTVRGRGQSDGVHHGQRDADADGRRGLRSADRPAVGAVDAAVTVTADAAVLETARSQVAGTVSQAEIKSLPINGRNFLDLALLVPGVSPTNVGGGTQLFPETSAVPGVGLSIGSQRNLSNNFIVDGLSANDDAAALSGMPYGVDAIDQFQVVTSGGQAELGRALGGYINVVTRSGTNALAAISTSICRDRRFNAANALSGPDAADEPAPVRLRRRRPARPRPDVLLRQRRAAPARSDRASSRSADAERAPSSSEAGGGRLPGSGRHDRRVSAIRSTRRTSSRRSIIRSRPRSAHGPLQPLRCRVDEFARRGRPERAERVRGARQSGPDHRHRQHAGRCRRGW